MYTEAGPDHVPPMKDVLTYKVPDRLAVKELNRSIRRTVTMRRWEGFYKYQREWTSRQRALSELKRDISQWQNGQYIRKTQQSWPCRSLIAKLPKRWSRNWRTWRKEERNSQLYLVLTSVSQQLIDQLDRKISKDTGNLNNMSTSNWTWVTFIEPATGNHRIILFKFTWCIHTDRPRTGPQSEPQWISRLRAKSTNHEPFICISPFNPPQ